MITPQWLPNVITLRNAYRKGFMFCWSLSMDEANRRPREIGITLALMTMLAHTVMEDGPAYPRHQHDHRPDSVFEAVDRIEILMRLLIDWDVTCSSARRTGPGDLLVGTPAWYTARPCRSFNGPIGMARRLTSASCSSSTRIGERRSV
jgi:hypothetical protein